MKRLLLLALIVLGGTVGPTAPASPLENSFLDIIFGSDREMAVVTLNSLPSRLPPNFLGRLSKRFVDQYSGRPVDWRIEILQRIVDFAGKVPEEHLIPLIETVLLKDDSYDVGVLVSQLIPYVPEELFTPEFMDHLVVRVLRGGYFTVEEPGPIRAEIACRLALWAGKNPESPLTAQIKDYLIQMLSLHDSEIAGKAASGLVTLSRRLSDNNILSELRTIAAKDETPPDNTRAIQAAIRGEGEDCGTDIAK